MALCQINNIMQLKCCFSCNASRASTKPECSEFMGPPVITLPVAVLPAQLLHLLLPPAAQDVRGWSRAAVSPLALILASRKASDAYLKG